MAAKGVMLQRDVLDQMDFPPHIAADLKVMAGAYFQTAHDATRD
ncbi:MAG: hypothetical protein Q7T69_08485 [Rhodoferax sp.]|nr:hypothetical protein [Rhodoferax sp.]